MDPPEGRSRGAGRWRAAAARSAPAPARRSRGWEGGGNSLLWEWDRRSPPASGAPSWGGGSSEPAAAAGRGVGRGRCAGRDSPPPLRPRVNRVGPTRGPGAAEGKFRSPLFNSAFPLGTDGPLYAGISRALGVDFATIIPTGDRGVEGWLSGQAEGAFTPEAL